MTTNSAENTIRVEPPASVAKSQVGSRARSHATDESSEIVASVPTNPGSTRKSGAGTPMRKQKSRMIPGKTEYERRAIRAVVRQRNLALGLGAGDVCVDAYGLSSTR